MTPEEYKWQVNLVRDRHEYLNLSYEQAEKIYAYEQDKGLYSEKHYFSAWEEFDYELTTYQEILTDEQLRIYEPLLRSSIERYKQDLKEGDDLKAREIAYNEELINYYETQFLPDFFTDHYLDISLLLHEKVKINYLKAEYKNFLNDTKKEILTSHFRHCRTFKPNELKAALLRHKILHILPDYAAFKYRTDEAAKAVANYLQSKVDYLPQKTEQLITRKFNELNEFHDANFKKHYGEMVDGWHVILDKSTPEEVKEHRVMTLLLLDKNQYASNE